MPSPVKEKNMIRQEDMHVSEMPSRRLRLLQKMTSEYVEKF